MINRLDITRLRGLENVRLTGLGEVTIIEGPGGSGKTTALEAAALAASGGNGAAALYHFELNHNAVDTRLHPHESWAGLFPGRNFERVVETAIADDEHEHRLRARCYHPHWNEGDVRVFEAGGPPQHELELRYTKATTGADGELVDEVEGDMHWLHGKYRCSSLDAPVAKPTTVTTSRDALRTLRTRYCRLRTLGLHETVVGALKEVADVTDIIPLTVGSKRTVLFAEGSPGLPIRQLGREAEQVTCIAIACAAAAGGGLLLIDHFGESLSEIGLAAASTAVAAAARRGVQVLVAVNDATARSALMRAGGENAVQHVLRKLARRASPHSRA